MGKNQHCLLQNASEQQLKKWAWEWQFFYGYVQKLLYMIVAGRYEVQEKLGSGNFSSVHTAIDKHNGNKVAVKIMKTHQNIALKEASLLKSFDHPNIVKLFDFQQDASTGQTRMVLEHMPENTLQLYQKQQFGLSQQQVKCVLFQCALGLSYIHSRGIIHRDIKPENILINKQTAEIKIIDLGLAVEQSITATDYVATRWYRAPENLLSTKEYTTKIDVFSLACVAVELYLGAPLFPGADNLDQLYKIFNVLGEPNDNIWPNGAKKFRDLGFRSSIANTEPSLSLSQLLKTSSHNFISLIEQMLIMNPQNRISSHQILQHPYFNDVKAIVPPTIYKRFLKDAAKDVQKKKEVSPIRDGFRGLARKQSLRKEVSLNKKPKNDEKKVQLQSYPLEASCSLSNLSNCRLYFKNQHNHPKNNQNDARALKNNPSSPQVNGLSFRGFNPVKAPKISVKQIARTNDIIKITKDSRNNSIDSRDKSSHNVSVSIDNTRKMKPSFLEQRIISRRITDVRDYRTPDSKSRSIHKLDSVQNRFEGLKLAKAPVLDQSQPFQRAEQFKSHRFMPFNEQNSRITRNLSEINPHSRGMIPDFRPFGPTNFNGFPKPRASPQPLNTLPSPHPGQKQEGVITHLKESIYTAPFQAKLQKLKIKPTLSPTNKYAHLTSRPNNQKSIDKEGSSIVYESKSKLTHTQELQRSDKLGYQFKTNNNSYYLQPNSQHFYPKRSPINNLKTDLTAPQSKIKLAKSLQPSEIRQPSNIGSSIGVRRETIQIPQFRPSILLMEKKEYQEPRLGTRKNGQNEKVVQNLSNFLNGNRDERNISINVNLSFVEQKERSITGRRGRI